MNTKTLLSLTLLGLSAGIGYCDRATLDETKTQIALPLETPPEIDGVVTAAEWGRAGGAAGDFWHTHVVPDPNDPELPPHIQGGAIGDAGSPPANDADLSFTVYAGYDANNLYIAVKVTDDSLMDDSAEADSANGNTWLDDSVEVFIDGDNSNWPTRDTTGTNPEVVGSGGQYVITINNAYREAEAGKPGYGPDAAWYARTERTANGYAAEFRISLATLGNPQPGDIIGFTVGVNDDDDGGNAERQVIWVGRPHTEATYGNLILGGRSYSAPKAAAPVVDGVIHAAEYPGAQEIAIEPFSGIFDIPSGDDTWSRDDLRYSAWVTHDDDAVYVAVDVTDDQIFTDTGVLGNENATTWEDDSVEIFFDADNSKNLARGTQQFEGQYVFTPAGVWRDLEANNPVFGQDGDWFAATSPTPTGYQVEYKIKKTALLSPVDGTVMGFHIAVNDDDGAGRKMQMGWSGRAHSEFTYGALTLVAGGVASPLKIESIQVVGNNLQLDVSNVSGTVSLQTTTALGAPQWVDVPGVTVTPGANGHATLTFPKPANSPAFYRAVTQ